MLGKSPGRGIYYGYIVTAAVFGTWFIGFGSFPTFGIFFKPILAEFGWSRADAALGFSLAIIIRGFLAIFAGWLTDRLGPRLVVIVFGSFLGISFFFLSKVTTLWQFQLYYASLGAIGLSALVVPVMATIPRWFTERRGLMMGIAQAGAGVGGLVFAPLAGWLILSQGWRSAYVIIGIIALAGIILAGAFLRRGPAEEEQLSDESSRVMASEIRQQNRGLQTAGFSLREAIATPQFWMISGLYAAFGFCRSTFTTHIAAHVQDLGFSLIDGANVMAAMTAATIIGRVGMGRVSDMIGNRRACVIGYAATTLVLIWGLVAKDMWAFYLFALVFGFGWGAQAVLRFALASEAFGLVSLGLLLGVFGLSEAGAATIGSYFAGYIFDLVGNYDPAFWMGIVVSIMGVFLAWRLRPIAKKDNSIELIT